MDNAANDFLRSLCYLLFKILVRKTSFYGFVLQRRNCGLSIIESLSFWRRLRMNIVILVAVFAAMPVAIEKENRAGCPSKTVGIEVKHAEKSEQKSQMYLLRISMWEDVSSDSGKLERRLYGEPALRVFEGRKCEFVSGGKLLSGAIADTHHLQFGTKVSAAMVSQKHNTVQLDCEISDAVNLESEDGVAKTYTQTLRTVCTIMLGEKKTITFEPGGRHRGITVEVKKLEFDVIPVTTTKTVKDQGTILK